MNNFILLNFSKLFATDFKLLKWSLPKTFTKNSSYRPSCIIGNI